VIKCYHLCNSVKVVDAVQYFKLIPSQIELTIVPLKVTWKPKSVPLQIIRFHKLRQHDVSILLPFFTTHYVDDVGLKPWRQCSVFVREDLGTQRTAFSSMFYIHCFQWLTDRCALYFIYTRPHNVTMTLRVTLRWDHDVNVMTLRYVGLQQSEVTVVHAFAVHEVMLWRTSCMCSAVERKLDRKVWHWQASIIVCGLYTCEIYWK
jgi:hypothetical protein